MKTRIMMRATLVVGLPAVTHGLGRLKRIRSALLRDAGREAGRGNVITATILVALYMLAG